MPHGDDGRRLEVVASVRRRPTLVSTLHGDGSARRRAADEDGVALAAARRTKETRHPELVGPWCQSLSSQVSKSVAVDLRPPGLHTTARKTPNVHI